MTYHCSDVYIFSPFEKQSVTCHGVWCREVFEKYRAPGVHNHVPELISLYSNNSKLQIPKNYLAGSDQECNYPSFSMSGSDKMSYKMTCKKFFLIII